METTEKKPSKRGKRGQGCIYLPKNSRNYWIKFSMNGRVYQEAANTESKNEALNFLRTRVSEVSSGKAVDCKKVTVQILADSMTKAWELAQKERSNPGMGCALLETVAAFFRKDESYRCAGFRGDHGVSILAANARRGQWND